MENPRFKFRIYNVEQQRYVATEFDKQFMLGSFIIEQCTGLKDKNGNLIYESDYVKIGENTYKVFWNNIKISLVNILNGDIIDISETITMEIIGNEHETKFDKI